VEAGAQTLAAQEHSQSIQNSQCEAENWRKSVTEENETRVKSLRGRKSPDSNGFAEVSLWVQFHT
jgi:hypothetical protein